MDDYCTCGFQRIDQALFDGDHVHCSSCRKVICCDVATLDNDGAKPHAAVMAAGQHFLCWRHCFRTVASGAKVGDLAMAGDDG